MREQARSMWPRSRQGRSTQERSTQERSTQERSTQERSMQERSMQQRSPRRFGGDGRGGGFGGTGAGWGFGRGPFLFRFFPPRNLFLGDLLGVVLVHDAGYVGARLSKWRHSPILLHALRTSVVSGQRLDEIEIVALQKFAQITASTRDIGLRIEGIIHAQLVSGAGHQLHKSAGAFRRNGARLASAFGVDDAVHQVGIEMIGGAGGVDDLIQTRRGDKFRRSRFRRPRFS